MIERKSARSGRVATGWLQSAPASAPSQDPEQVARQIGVAIATRRRRRGMSQAELAQTLGCDRSTVCRWEMGERLPSLPHLIALGRVFGCGAGALLPE